MQLNGSAAYIGTSNAPGGGYELRALGGAEDTVDNILAVCPRGLKARMKILGPEGSPQDFVMEPRKLLRYL